MVMQAVPLQPMEVNGGADIHLQPMEEPTLEQVDAPKGGCDPMGSLCWSKLLAGPVDPWREREEPMLEQEGNLKRYPTPYPDELKNMVKTVQTIVHRLKDEESTEDIAKESKREGQTVSVKDVGVKTSEIASIKNKADERKQYSAGSSVQKPTEPEVEHSTANSQMTALVKSLQNMKTVVNHEDMLEESEELSSDEEMKMAEMRPPLIETSINQPKVVALSNNKKDDSKDADSLSDEATHNSNQNNSNCSSPSRMSDSVSLNTDSSQDIPLCSPEKETHAAVLSKIRREDENLNNLLQNGGELSITVEEKINVQKKVTNLSEYKLSIEERLGLIRKGVDLSTPTESSHKSDQMNMNINKLVSEEAVPVPVERLQTQEIVSVKGFLNDSMKEESEYLENGNKYPINKVNGHPEEAVQSPSKDELMRSTTVDHDSSAELSVSRSTEDLSPQRSGPVMKSHSITSMDTDLKIYNIVTENGSQQPNSVVKSASGSADGKNIVRSKSATLLYDQPLQVFPGPLLSSDLVSSTKTVFKFDSNHNPEGANAVRGSVTSGAQMFCTPQYNIQYSSSATTKDTLWSQKQNTQAEQGSLPPSHLLKSDSAEIPSYVKHSANMNLSNHNNVRASVMYNTHQQMAGRYIDVWAIPPNDRLLPGATRHALQRQSSVSSTASINVGDTGPSRRAWIPEGDYLTYRDLHSVGRAPPVMSGQQRPLSARTYSIDDPNVSRPQSARPSVNEIPERTMSVSDFNYSWTSPSKRSNPRVNSDQSLLDPPGKSKVPHDWREQVLRHIEAKKLEKSMLSRSFNSNYAAVSSFHYGSSRDLHGSQSSVALSVADRRGSGVHIVRHPQASTPGDQCQDEVFISGQQNCSSATLSLKDIPPDSMKKIAVQIPLTNGQMCQPQRPQANHSQVHYLPPQSSVARHPSREQLIDYLMLKVAHQPLYTQSQCSPRQSHKLAKQEIRVRIDKDPELGFSISGGVGGRGNPFRPEDDGIFVTRVQPEGPASRLLQPGDKIIQEEEEAEPLNEVVTNQSLSLSELRDMQKDFSHRPGEQIVTWLLPCWDNGASSLELEGRETKQLGSLSREGSIDKVIGKGAQALSLWRQLLSGMKERYPFSDDVLCRPGKWTTMEQGIQYLRELAMWEMFYYDSDNVQLPIDPDEVQCTRPVWRKFVQSVPSWYTNSLAVMDWKSEEAPTVDEVAG
ncbi:erbin-like [Grus japonensis]|uniref:Erbin-like n=1 Tax=Grus japonensis TaxID=30415 RepID=A0ABC9Y2I0_GRUJA